VAKEAGVAAQIVGGGDEYKRVKEIAALGLPLVVPVSFLEAPDVSDPDDALEVGIEELRHFDQGPGNAAALQRAGVTFALTTTGLKDPKVFRANVARSIERGLEADRALAAVTTVPARLLGLQDRLGTLAVGKAANLTVVRGDLFAPKSRVREVWVDGRRFEVVEKDGPGTKGRFELAWSGTTATLVLAQDKEPTAEVTVGGETVNATDVRLVGPHASFTLTRGGQAERFEMTERRDRLTGSVLSGTSITALTGVRSGEAEPDQPQEGEKTAEAAKPDPTPIETPVVMGNSEPWRMPSPEAPAVVLVKNATIWTAGPQGTLTGSDLLVRAGKIAAVGHGLEAPPEAVTLDATGRHVVPGIIDTHSHSALLGSVNECTNSVTAEVRVEDVVNSESVNIYRQLAGGTTVMHLLHGSCNAIGGQSALVKNKWGEPPDRLRFAGAPPTIKFALGENPKRSYIAGAPAPPEGRRYPATRAGVEQVIREAFTKARDYREGRADFRAGRRLAAPRPDLQAEAVLEVLEGKRLIHSHAYRQDEILMLMRLTEEFGIRVQTFQHILEGYKVADEMAAHGASASAFSDWWAYKFEVIDAIPYNGFLMWDRGVSVSYNSDSDELGRILNLEAAKAMKYGVPADEALRFVTLHPARQLKIDDRVGSLEVGKDADFSIRTESPLSPTSRVEETWIEGRKYFDRGADLAGRAALAEEREALVAKAKAARKAKRPEGSGNRTWPPRYLDDADVSGNECGDAGRHAHPSGEAR
jgi:imidazolonepropionase-like amidohydrolase